MEHMFDRCKSLKSVDISSFNTQNVTNMSFIFFDCVALESIDLPNFGNQNIIQMDRMFGECKNELKIKIKDKYNIKDEAFK